MIRSFTKWGTPCSIKTDEHGNFEYAVDVFGHHLESFQVRLPVGVQAKQGKALLLNAPSPAPRHAA